MRECAEGLLFGFQRLPAEFSLSKLQHTCEIALDESPGRRNFQRRMQQSGIIEMTQRSALAERRPDRLYRCRSDTVAELKARIAFHDIFVEADIPACPAYCLPPYSCTCSQDIGGAGSSTWHVSARTDCWNNFWRIV
jgi:hypothetical protein